MIELEWQRNVGTKCATRTFPSDDAILASSPINRLAEIYFKCNFTLSVAATGCDTSVCGQQSMPNARPTGDVFACAASVVLRQVCVNSTIVYTDYSRVVAGDAPEAKLCSHDQLQSRTRTSGCHDSGLTRLWRYRTSSACCNEMQSLLQVNSLCSDRTGFVRRADELRLFNLWKTAVGPGIIRRARYGTLFCLSGKLD